mmetsp:Transcript_30794/g.45281  ORF Transcript_30794/g.45281 Transcript_30794/m.45281 type:complete len:246 (-) Transcript_30794:137-874(-)
MFPVLTEMLSCSQHILQENHLYQLRCITQADIDQSHLNFINLVIAHCIASEINDVWFTIHTNFPNANRECFPHHFFDISTKCLDLFETPNPSVFAHQEAKNCVVFITYNLAYTRPDLKPNHYVLLNETATATHNNVFVHETATAANNNILLNKTATTETAAHNNILFNETATTETAAHNNILLYKTATASHNNVFINETATTAYNNILLNKTATAVTATVDHNNFVYVLVLSIVVIVVTHTASHG